MGTNITDVIWSCVAEVKILCTALLFLCSLLTIFQFFPSLLSFSSVFDLRKRVSAITATTSNLQLTVPSSSSSSSSSSSPSNWDVFLSFYGKDTRANFISHLYHALDQAGFQTFMDDPELRKGQEISSGLLHAIRASKMFVVVISENYARSTWCLDELIEILSCNKTGKEVVPVFYYVDPEDVRHQKRSFEEAFQYHVDKKRYSDDMIQTWISALAQVAGLSGHHLKRHANENEAKKIQEIVDNVARQLSTNVLYLEEHQFGLDCAVEEIYQKLTMELNHVRAIGICGMGGIGKTTTAKAFYNKYSNKFDVSCFVDEVKQYSQGGSPLLPLLNLVLTGLLRKKDNKVTDVERGLRQLKHILCFKKALIVLDDLDQTSYLEFLSKLCNSFSARSRIIVTTRDVNLLEQLRIDITEVDIYMAKKLGDTDSLKLFCYHAFGTHTPPVNLREYSKSFVSYAGGHPLALKVLGSSLRGRTHVSFWIAQLEKVKKNPENGIQKILQVSYDELCGTDKALFLDIACFFVGKHNSDAVVISESCGYFPKVGIPILVERCLLEIDENGKFQMHDLLRDMGRELGKCTHLFWRGNALSDLRNQEIEVLIMDFTFSKEKVISSDIFEKLPKLRLLEIIHANGINGHFMNSFHELRCIYWSNCPWTELPSGFQPQKLVYLNMPYSNLKRLWNGALPFRDLKVILLEYSLQLETTPDFGNSKSVQYLDLEGCESLLQVHPSIRDLTDLCYLNLEECTQLRELGEPTGQLNELSNLKRSPEPMTLWASMSKLFLAHCSNLRQLPKQLGDMKRLKSVDASCTAIEELPDSITQLKEMDTLKLSHCNKLRKLPEDIGNMEGLQIFSASYTAIEQLPDSFVDLINLRELYLDYCENLRNLPKEIWKLKLLKVVHLSFCSKLERLPDELGNMQCLESLYASYTAIEQIPDSIQQLSRLQVLSVMNCVKLRYVPNGVWNLTSLTTLNLFGSGIGIGGRNNLPDTVENTKLTTLSLSCDIRSWFPMILSFSSLERLCLGYEGESLSSAEPISLSELYNLQVLELYPCTGFGSSFPELPPSLTRLILSEHATLVHLPNLSSLKQLKRLDIISYHSLESLPPLPPHLQSLMVYDCGSLQVPSDMSVLKELVEFYFGRYHRELVSLKESWLQFAEYKSSGRTLCCDIQPLLGDNFLGLAIWVLVTPKCKAGSYIKVVVANKTYGTTECFWIPICPDTGGELYSLGKCISRDQISATSGDRIEISFGRELYFLNGKDIVPGYEQVKVEMCAAHVIQKTPSTPDFPSFFNNLINRA